jgi:hypothetical protein
MKLKTCRDTAGQTHFFVDCGRSNAAVTLMMMLLLLLLKLPLRAFAYLQPDAAESAA